LDDRRCHGKLGLSLASTPPFFYFKKEEDELVER
jgi:hypothetical protein